MLNRWWDKLPKEYIDNSHILYIRLSIKLPVYSNNTALAIYITSATFPLTPLEQSMKIVKLILPNQASQLEEIWESFLKVYDSRDNPLGVYIGPLLWAMKKQLLWSHLPNRARLIEGSIKYTVLQPIC